MTDFIFIRHGETDWNRQQRFQGQIDVPLNAAGHAQARLLAAHLGRSARSEGFFSSDLVRAQQTAAPLASAWGTAPLLHAGLREQAFGVLEGLDAATIRAKHPELWSRWLEHRADYALPGGGESLRAFHRRVVDAVRELAEAYANAPSTAPSTVHANVHADARADRSLTVVTHGGVLDMLWRTAHGLPLDGLRECEIPNTGINRLRWRAGTLEVLGWADARHLNDGALPPTT